MDMQGYPESFLELTRANVLEHGWVVQSVASRSGIIAYTVGLTEAGLAELAIFGAPPGTGAGILNDLARQSLAGELRPGQVYTVAAVDKPCEVFGLPDGHTRTLLQVAVLLYGQRVTGQRVQVRM